jgi:hypothetical protein
MVITYLTHLDFLSKIQNEDTEHGVLATSVPYPDVGRKPSGCLWITSGLVSLLEILKFSAGRFVEISRKIAEMRTGVKKASPMSSGYSFDNIIADEEWLRIIDGHCLRPLADDCQAIGLSVSLEFLKTVRGECASGRMSVRDWTARLDGLQEVIEHELATVVLLHIPKGRASVYEQPRKGWESIIDRFPTALGDIEEMQKSFALSRYSAAVFHSVQVIEVGLIELGRFLQVNDPISGWSAVATELKRIIEKKHPTRSDFERDNFAFIEQLQGTVEALKNAWRNKISHTHGKLAVMGTDFNEEIAEEIILATRAFMRRLTDGLPAAI